MNKQKHHPRRAFTFVEFLAVMAIIAILLSILFPAILQARHAARRAQCKNNLRQIGLAMHNYLDTFGVYPPGYLHQTDPHEVANASGFGWGALLLPFSDQQALYGTFNFNVPIWDDANATARTVRIPNYICPTDRISEGGFYNMAGEQYSPSSYVANFGPGLMDVNPQDRRGVFSRNSSTRVEQVVDGLSNTFFIGERINGPLRNPSSLGASSFGSAPVKFETTWAGAVRDVTDPANDNPHLVLFQSGHVPHSPKSDRRDASSSHQTGAHFLRGDGSVHFLSKDIDLDVYRSLSTRAGGELLHDF